MIRRKVSIRGFGMLVIVGLGLSLYFILARAILPSRYQPLYKEQLLARAEAANLASFFQSFGNSIAVLGQAPSLDSRDTATVKIMDAFVEQWRGSGLVGGVILTDRDGVVRFNSNLLRVPDVGRSVADRNYFVWAKNQTREGEYYISRSTVSRLGASKGQTIVVVASPVFQNGTFSGVLGASVMLEPLTKRYLGLLRASESTEVYLIDQEEGRLLYSSVDLDATGSGVSEYFQKSSFLGNQLLAKRLRNAFSANKEGRVLAVFISPKTARLKIRLMAYSPVALGSQNWLLIMSSLPQEVFDFFWLRN